MAVAVDRTSPTTLTATRRFAASPARVWAAHMEPALVKRWCFGPDDWSLPVCEIDPRPGGALLYEWTDGQGHEFRLTGRFEVVEPPAGGRTGRSVHVEVRHLPDPLPECRVTTTFAPDRDGTLLTVVMDFADAATAEAMLALGMAHGLELGYARLDALEPAAA
jgi:uncharacterized protein YndB with AHSA1/START domain